MKWIRPLVSLLLLAILYTLIDLGQVIATLRSIATASLAAALALFALSVVLFVAKWKACFPVARFRVLLRSYLSSLFFYLFPTGTLGAEASKLSIARNERVSVGTVAGTLAFDKLTGLSALALLGSIAGAVSQPTWAHYVSVLLLFIAAAAFALSLHGHALITITARLLPSSTVANKVAMLACEWDEVRRQPGLIPKTAILGIASQSTLIAIYACLATGLGISYSLPELTICVVVANLISILPITLAGVGARELGLVAMLARTGVDPNSGASLTIAVFGIFLTGAAVGFITLLLPADNPVEP